MALSELEIRKLEKIHIANGIGVHIFRLHDEMYVRARMYKAI